MYYELTAYVIAFTVVPSVALLALLVCIYRESMIAGGVSPLIATILSVGGSVLSLVAAELVFHLISDLREFRVKLPPLIAGAVFVAAFVYFSLKGRFRFLVSVPYFLVGAASFVCAGVPVLFWFGCATGPVCI